MQIIPADFSRRIDLPGVGPCPRPVDIDQSVTGFEKLVSLRIYSFTDGSVINGEAEGDEVFIVVLNGAADIAVSGATDAAYTLSAKAGDRAIYLPPDHHYRLTAKGDVDVAYARARARGERKPASFGGKGDDHLSDGHYAESLEFCLLPLIPGKAQEIATDGASPLPERLVHIQGNGVRIISGAPHAIAKWQTIGLKPQEIAVLEASEPSFALAIAAR